MPTARQSLIENILIRGTHGGAISFTPTVGLRNAVDAAGFVRFPASDGKDEIRNDQVQFMAQAIEAAALGQPQLLQAIYTAERDRAVTTLNGTASNATAASNAASSQAAAITGTSLS